MFDIITFGSATKDIFLRTEHFAIGDFNKQSPGEEICLPYGLKVDIDEVHFHSGGGGTNVAATFVSQGFKTAFCGIIGKDDNGEEVLKELKSKKIDCRFVAKTAEKPTDLSIILSTARERTILVYRGASTAFSEKDIPWQKIKQTGWFYLAPFARGTEKLFSQILDFARKNGVKTMVNPGSSFLNLSRNEILPILKKIDILLLNQEEAQVMIKNPSLKELDLVRAVREDYSGVLIITNGEERVFISNNDAVYSADPYDGPTVDKTGAGDAFGSGFLSGYLNHKTDMIFATQLAMANAISCFSRWGAKEGLLKKNQSFKKVSVSAGKLI